MCLAIGFAAVSVPFGIDATAWRILKGVWDAVRGVREEGKDGGRSPKNSGRTVVDAFKWR
jgi:hypothetical protein